MADEFKEAARNSTSAAADTSALETVNDVKTALERRLATLSPAALDIRDDSAKHVGHAGAASGARHFSVTIVSEHFLGLTRLARHRAILERVGDLIPYPVHALAIEAYAPDEKFVLTKG
jgi:BolA family transcriptional regulator, general stress-responsive regulator